MTAPGADGASEGADDRLVEAARQGDRAALEQLLRLHQPRIHAVCRRLTGNDADALDATQDALISIVRGLEGFDGRARFSTWCYRIATNAALDELRRRARRPDLALVDREGDVSEPIDPGALAELDRVDDRDRLDAALRAISVEFRTAVVLRDVCRLDYAEIAEVLALAPGTVRSRIARGRAQLADLLGGNQTDPDVRPTTAP
jgi:RNA polymerase sigma-70 factor (ECF subfamily)